MTTLLHQSRGRVVRQREISLHVESGCDEPLNSCGAECAAGEDYQRYKADEAERIKRYIKAQASGVSMDLGLGQFLARLDEDKLFALPRALRVASKQQGGGSGDGCKSNPSSSAQSRGGSVEEWGGGGARDLCGVMEAFVEVIRMMIEGKGCVSFVNKVALTSRLQNPDPKSHTKKTKPLHPNPTSQTTNPKSIEGKGCVSAVCEDRFGVLAGPVPRDFA